jgi:glycosyltransferase involved in cell wall biosynthesis
MNNNYGNVVIIIPMYNEETNIQRVINGIQQVVPNAKIVAIDDGSTDESAKMASLSGVVVIRHPFNLGYGGALQTGYKYALRKGFDTVIQLDGDGQHDPSYIPAFLQAIKDNKADVVIGSRFLGKDVYRIPFARKIGMRIFSFITSAIINQHVTDSTSGYQALNRNILQFYADRRYPVDFPDADVLIMLKRSGFKMKEISVKMYGSLKSMHAGFNTLYYIFKMFLSIFLTILRKEKFKKEV